MNSKKIKKSYRWIFVLLVALLTISFAATVTAGLVESSQETQETRDALCQDKFGSNSEWKSSQEPIYHNDARYIVCITNDGPKLTKLPDYEGPF